MFLSGLDVPDLGDLAIYGTLRAIDGLPAHRVAVYERDGPLADWYERMKATVELQAENT